MIIKKFEEQVEKFPERNAVITDKIRLTYGELNRYSNRLANTITGIDLGSGKKAENRQNTALLFEHSADMIVGVLGALKAGKVYVPLDVTYPENRLTYMLEHSESYLVITNRRNRALAERLTAALKTPPVIVDIDAIVTDTALSSENLQREWSGEKLAYILYTSGSTGRPKGVVQDHRNVCYYIRNWTGRFSITHEDRVTLFSAFSHDGAGQDMFGALHNGAALYPFNILSRPNIAELSAWLKEEKITIWHSVPTLYRYFLNTLSEDDTGSFTGLRYILLGGEAIRDHDIQMYRRYFPQTTLANVYGQTESSVSTIWQIKPGEVVEHMLIGDPLDETKILIIDEEDEVVEDLGTGEIVVSCDHIALGYWKDKETTGKVFTHDPGLGKLYRTGDLGRLMADGRIEFMGRKDGQVKIRGFRVEMGEIETRLLNHPAVKEAVVTAREDEEHMVHICAYIVPGDTTRGTSETANFTVTAMREYLTGELPEYMIPSYLVQMEKLPVTPNGKIDRKRLPEPEHLRPQLGETYLAPKTGKEKEVSEIWKEILKLDQVGIKDNFFDLGGTSFDILKIMRKVHEVFHQDVPVVTIFRYPTVGAFAEYLEEEEGRRQGGGAGETREAVPGKGKAGKRKPRQASADPYPPTAVIGMAGRFPGARNLDEFWKNLQQGIESIGFFSTGELQERGVDGELVGNSDYVPAYGVLEGVDCFDAAFFQYPPAEAEMMDPQLRLLLEGSWEALENAGYNPESYEGEIGVYVGNSPNQYWVALTYFNQKNTLDTMFLNNNYSTKVSYKLNLKGPSVIVQTACSTSLVAVHLACRGLAGGECEMALAGGVSVSVPDRQGYLYREGMILSPDGHCRAFAARAGGTIFGSGVGIVVLKRLEDALADGDTIDAVIKGSAINNDGNRKVGITAPSVEGQAGVIVSACEVAGIEPQSISYVETHGTGTLLGDPVEIEALTLAYAADKRKYCAIGSVKTNIGHLNAAAGVVGLIKTVLALRHKQIPPSLHFETPNPGIDFENSPFYVNTRLIPWEGNGTPRRAGVSAFGIGGTNAHVVLEEWPAAPCQGRGGVSPLGQSRQYHIILFSAKTPSALEKMTENLLDYFKENPGLDLADVAYTLHLGRKTFKYRRMLLCSHREEAVKLLLSPHATAASGTANVFNSITVEENPPAVFMFPGQGSQYVGMGSDLYRTEPVFRREMDRCFEIIKPLIGFDIKDILYPLSDQSDQSDQSDLSDRSDSSDSKAINRTEIAQPAIFIVEYALAKLLERWGIRPYAMIGHSIGEYVAACLSGVFTLEDALKLVVLRGKLMQGMPAGEMLSVPLPESVITPYLTGELSLAAVNSSSHSVVSGSPGAITRLIDRLSSRGYETRRLQTSHAFHSAAMDPVLGEYEQAVRQVVLNKPRLPYISNVTGRWIEPREVVQPGYWARHLRSAVRFSDGISQLFKEPGAIFIEVGPGQALSTFVRQHEEKKPGQRVIDLIRHPREQVSDTWYLSNKIGHLWLYGKAPDWSGYYGEEKKYRQRIALPVYPFDRQHYWLEGDLPGIGIVKDRESEKPRTGKKLDLADWFYVPAWEPAPLTAGPKSEEKDQGGWLVFIDGGRIASGLLERLKQEHRGHVIIARKGRAFTNPCEGEYEIDPGQESDYRALYRHLEAANRLPRKILHLWNVEEKEKENGGGEDAAVAEALELGYYSLERLARVFGEPGTGKELEILVITNHMHPVTGEEEMNPGKAAVLGVVQVAAREYPDLRCRSIDIDRPGPGQAAEPTENIEMIENLLMEIESTAAEIHVAYRDNERLVRRFIPIRLESPTHRSPLVKEKGVYLVTGGLGGIGLVLAEYLAKNYKARLVLTGRSGLPGRDRWEDLLLSYGPGDSTAGKIRKIKEMEAAGAEVYIGGANVADLQQMRLVLAEAEKRYGAVNGVIHAAGIPDGALIRRRTREISEAVFEAKIKGTLVLETLFKEKNLDFMVLCSSVSAVLAPVGQAAYCGANAFLDAYAGREHAAGATPLTVSIDWDNWQQIGMAARAVKSSRSIPVEHRLFERCEIHGGGQDPDRAVFTARYRTETHWVLDEHRIMGNATLPGTAYLEMARAAAEVLEGTGTLELREVYFLNPLIVKDEEEKEVHTILKRREAPAAQEDPNTTPPMNKKAGRGYTFSIISRITPGQDRWMEHARGEVIPGEGEIPRDIDLEEIEKTCTQGDESREIGHEGGALRVGPRWNNVRRFRYGGGKALGNLELPPEFADETRTYKLHPALMDTAATLLRRGEKNRDRGAYIPFSYKKITINGGIPAAVTVYARAVNPSGPAAAEGETREFDIVILDREGHPRVDIRGFVLKQVKTHGETGAEQNRVSTAPGPADPTAKSARNFFLGLADTGSFDNLVFRPAPRPAPGPGEVEIRVSAAGLNFKEVLRVLGMLGPVPRDYKFGLECAGKITKVGPGVEEFKEGDEVMAFGTNCFGRYITTPAALAARKPKGMSDAEAATIPLAFLTVYYALVKLGRLTRGERVLIHSAAGGVGMAAIQVARWQGAEIFATAGSPEKQAYLRSLGIRQVMGSRSLDFVEEVKKQTGGRGVDVVLNSLAGEFIPAGLSVLAPYGRFLEIGLRDILNDTALGLRPFLKGLSYISVLLSGDLPGIDTLWREVAQHVREGIFTPLPLRKFPLHQVGQAFAYMTTGQHIGKIVVEPGDRDVMEEMATKEPSTPRGDHQNEKAYPYAFFFTPIGSEDGLGAGGLTNRPGDTVQTKLETGILPAEGVEVFNRVLGVQRFPQVVVSTTALPARIRESRGPLETLVSETLTGPGSLVPRYDRPEMTTPYVAPVTKTHGVLAQIWQEFLGIKQVGIHDDFFQLGGDSLKAISLTGKIRKKTGIEIPLTEFFARPTINRLGDYIDSTGVTRDFTSILPEEKKEYYPLSPAQTRLYILQAMGVDSTGYNVTFMVALEGEVEPRRLENSLERLIDRHEGFRTSFEMVRFQPVQRVHNRIAFNIEYNDISKVGTKVKVKEEVESCGQVLDAFGEESLENCQGRGEVSSPIGIEKIIGDFIRPFDLSQAPLLRVGLIKTENRDHLLVIDVHHIVHDGTSLGIFFQELTALYGGKKLQPLRIQYKDYAQWQNQPQVMAERKNGEDFWVETFTGEIPVLELPLDFPRPAVQVFKGNRVKFVLEEEETGALKAVAREQEATLFMILLAVLNVVLMKLSGQEDIVVGTPTAGRGHPDLEKIIGVFINTLALRNYPDREKTFKIFLKEVRERSIGAFQNQGYPFEELVERVKVRRDPSRNPLFDVLLRLQNFESPTDNLDQSRTGDLQIKNYPFDPGRSLFDLDIACVESGPELFFNIDYCTALYKEESVRGIAGYIKQVAGAAREKGFAAKKLSGIEILSPEEKQRLLQEFNNTAVDYPREKTTRELFEEQAAGMPDRVALLGMSHLSHLSDQSDLSDLSDLAYISITYRELEKRSGRLAEGLKGQGVIPGTIVGIMMNRTVDMMVGLMGIMKAGGVYLPIDPGYPGERIEYMLKDSGAGILVTADNIESLIDRTDMSYRSYRKPATTHLTQHTRLCYVIYTSGSTGKPKGVAIRHCSVVNFIKGMTGLIDFSATKTILAVTTLCFDIFVLETLLPLTRGMRVVIADDLEQSDPGLLAGVIRRQGVRMVQLTPSRLKMLLDIPGGLAGESLTGVEELIVGGEAFPVHLLKSLQERYPGKIYNVYGPTETTVWSSVKDLTGKEEITIGCPIANTRFYILDNRESLQPIGVPGELFIGGDGVAAGYLNNPELTAEKFIMPSATKNPFINTFQKLAKKTSFCLDPEVFTNSDAESLMGWGCQPPFEKPPLDPAKLLFIHHSPITKQLPEGRLHLRAKSQEPRAILYKTGDLARWLSNGEIEFLGRQDFQVKVRGYRIELEEIENRLMKHPGVQEVVVIVKKEETGDNTLCAYIVRGENKGVVPGSAEMREHLAAALPDYMIPSYFVFLEQMPLTLNGKVDRKMLPDPGFGVEKEGGYKAPRDRQEAKLVEMWSEILGIEKSVIGIETDFFVLGGHSLKVTQLLAKVHREFNRRVSWGEFFKKPTVKGLTQIIRTAAPDRYTLIPKAEKKEYYRLSSSQERLYVLQQVEGETIGHNLPSVVKLEGKLEREKFEAVVRQLVRRHEAFRTSFITIKGEPVQVIREEPEFAIEYYEIPGDEVSSLVSIERIIREFIRPFDLSRPPLLRIGLIRLGAEEHILMKDVHHIIYDGTSLTVFYREFIEGYRGRELPGMNIQYRDFAEWQSRTGEKEKLRNQERYWVEEFEGEIPVLNMPVDFPRPAEQSYEGNTLRFEMSREMTGELKNFAVEQGTTLFTLLLSLYTLMLSKLSGQEDIVVGTPVAGREHPELQSVIGVFLNTLVIRSHPNPARTYQQFLDEVKTKTVNAFDNQDYPFDNLVEKVAVNRDLSRNPLFDAMLILHTQFDPGNRPTDEQPGLVLKRWGYRRRISQFDMTLVGFEENDGLAFNVEYCTALFREETITRYIDYFKNIVTRVMENPGQVLAQINIRSEEEKRRVLEEFNQTAVEYPREKTVHRLIEEQGERTPDHVALIGQTALDEGPDRPVQPVRHVRHVQLTYNQLNEQSQRWAGGLMEKGVLPDTIVGIMMERSAEMIIGILAILKAGGAYLPMDPATPGARLEYMLADSKAKILLSDRNYVRTGHCPVLILDLVHAVHDEIGIQNRGTGQNNSTGTGQCPVPTHLPATTLAYVIYTSGSTGKPKGVMIAHYSVGNFIKGITDIIPFTERDTILSLTTLSFDIFGLETLLPLTRGARVIIGGTVEQISVEAAAAVLVRGKVTLFQVTPSRLQGFIAHPEAGKALKSLAYLLVGGEAFPGPLLQKAREITGGRIINLYGPTETTIWSAVKDLTGEEPLTIGRPIANTRVYILDKNDGVVPIGTVGELCIGGDGVARGYLNKPELTAGKFLIGGTLFEKTAPPHPPHKSFLLNTPEGRLHLRAKSQEPRAILYKTGDLARWLSNGEIEFIGRLDHQVKIRGFRIELAEIESHLQGHEAIKDAVVIVEEDERKDKYLCAYIVKNETTDEAPDITKLRAYLSGRLPEYMIPSTYIQIEKIPLNQNGKVDRKALQSYKGVRLASGMTYVAPAAGVQSTIADTWKEILGLDTVGIDDNFFELGGSSMKVLRLNSRLKQELEKDIPIAVMFRYVTIRSFIGYLARQEDGKRVEREKQKQDTLEKSIRNYKTSINKFKNLIEKGAKND